MKAELLKKVRSRIVIQKAGSKYNAKIRARGLVYETGYIDKDIFIAHIRFITIIAARELFAPVKVSYSDFISKLQ